MASGAVFFNTLLGRSAPEEGAKDVGASVAVREAVARKKAWTRRLSSC